MSLYLIVSWEPGEGEGVRRLGQDDVRVSDSPAVSVVLQSSFVDLLHELPLGNPSCSAYIEVSLS